MTSEDEIFAFLERHGISYRAFSHPVTDDIAEKLANDRAAGIEEAAHCKNLFLVNRAGTRHFLLTVPYGESFHTGPDSRAMGSGRLSFATSSELQDYLHAKPGMVSPLELIFAAERGVEFFMDSRLFSAKRLCFHPADDSKTVVMETPVFLEKFLPAAGFQANSVVLLHG